MAQSSYDTDILTFSFKMHQSGALPHELTVHIIKQHSKLLGQQSIQACGENSDIVMCYCLSAHFSPSEFISLILCLPEK